MDVSDRRKRTRDEAAAWWLELQGEASRAEREKFVDWLRESPLHVVEMLRIAQVHNALEQFDQWARLDTSGASNDAGNDETVVEFNANANAVRQTPSRKPRGVWLGALAASLLVASVATMWFIGNLHHMIETSVGERREVSLSDGSVLQIDPDTRLRVNYQDKVRRVALERGRALFRVAKDATRPFLVQAGETTIRAVGTAFGVDRTGRDLTVTVAEGKVAIQQSSRGAIGTNEPGTGEVPADAVLLAINQQASVRPADPRPKIKQVDSSRELAWAEGRLVFESTPIAEVLSDFNRYNQLQMHAATPDLGAHPITGVFSAADPKSFIAFLQTVMPVRADREGQSITIVAIVGETR